jgi:hypothetical protein
LLAVGIEVSAEAFARSPYGWYRKALVLFDTARRACSVLVETIAGYRVWHLSC